MYFVSRYFDIKYIFLHRYMQKSSGTVGGVMDPVPEHVVEVCNLDRGTVCIKGVLIQKRDFKTVFYMAQALSEHCYTSTVN